jgi:hypothetical protein
MGPFHESAALIAVEVQAGDGARSKRIDSSEEVSVVIRLETATPDAEVRCGVCFVPRSGEAGVRVEHPEPLHLSDPGPYVFLARVPAGTLPAGRYKVHADALVATGAERDANALTRDAGRVRIVGEPDSALAPDAEPSEHWDGCVVRRADADWAVG